MAKTALWIVLPLIFWGLPSVFSEEEEFKGGHPETRKLFLHIRQLWLKRDWEAFKPLLAEKVVLNLGKPESNRVSKRFSKDHALAVLAQYFARIEMLEFRYPANKMSRARAVGIVRYRLTDKGVQYQSNLYLYLCREWVEEAEEYQWKIESLNEY